MERYCTMPRRVTARLGHSTIGITMDLYSHVLKDMDKEAADKLNDVIHK
ncbi:integrase [Clostridium ljungdahlii]|uniref:Integrase n=1 Tax=Clostridium ljungdahlii (strain ATCC 55383 / DSM 13528 / PETC) TaxID=748727 RepID=A0ABX2U009_CLOLD|nr:integrase [Clostridium ljungdahlii]OAA89836.1 hypothetical protein WX45_01674 [Clostridium ljungdahlii DSM 13528]